MAEFNVRPSRTKQEFITNTQNILQEVKDIVHPLEVAQVPSAEYSVDVLEHPQAKVIGCDRDFNAWTDTLNPSPCVAESTLRCAGGHVHVSTEEDKRDVVKGLDLGLGVPAVLLDEDTGRRLHYGQAGSYRHKKYGVEYRPLSNFWIFNEHTIGWVFDQVQWVVSHLQELKEVFNDKREEIEEAMNNCNKDVASSLCAEFNLLDRLEVT
jgi:hypothetical protein